MTISAPTFPILRNVFIPTEHLWIKNKIAVMKSLQRGSVQLCFVWIGILSVVNFIILGLPELTEKLAVLNDWAIAGIVYACGAAVLAHASTYKRFWASNRRRISFGKWHDAIADKARKKPIIIRSLERLLFICHASMILLLMTMSIAPRLIMTLYNLNILS